MARGHTSDQRLSRQEWLDHALVALSEKGQAGQSIQNLSESLGVSRGSFYWHFTNRDDFVHALLEHWYQEYTAVAPVAVERDGGTPEERLARLMRLVHEQNLTRFDLTIRLIASHDSQFARWVRKADRFRLNFIESLFEEMGFTENDLRIRARTCLAYMSTEHDLFDKLDRKHRSDLVNDLHVFLVRK